ncbi:cation efflux family protein [Capsaspora owczarzaki ATCC 30864]|uniref:Cation efflux family protein n=1 Tax=Capsaspora owczarzaki (strain ATCC 30864) TaxID=595528 RepID=A0A0D2UL33_CAPO3|nr:cation efflux family protein [Capsaspora owczarzaki ATCC 30864]KJE95806.1 cation efflux family protein [Capsaspora owczarzaki ATCC 30864]|eukprot:XP_004344966.2 cation efflux family protein [Capsaspora owczarzaki ATCC 30864]
MSSNRTVRLSITLSLTLSFFVVELVVGNMTNSVALIADSFHMLSDVLSLLVGLFAIRIAKHTLSSKNTFGWVRAEVLGALINGVFLIALCFSIFVDSITRFFSPEEIEDPRLVLYVGSAGLFINLIGMMLFHNHAGHGHSHGGGSEVAPPTETTSSTELQAGIFNSRQVTEVPVVADDGHGHAHGHGHGHAAAASAPSGGHGHSHGGSLNMRGVFLHIAADALGSVAVVISALVFEFADFDGKVYIDPALSLFIACLLLSHSIPLVKQSSMILLQSVPSTVNVETIKSSLVQLAGVVDVHELHVWELSEGNLIATVHITSDAEDSLAIVSQIKGFFHRFGIHSTTVQLEHVQNSYAVDDEKACLLDCSAADGVDDCSANTCCTNDNAVKARRTLRFPITTSTGV